MYSNLDKAQVMKEQLELMKTQENIRNNISKINEQLNQLMIEELQLKSRDIAQNSSFSQNFQNESKSEQVSKLLDNTDINKQVLVLHTMKLRSKKNAYEEEEDDDYNLNSEED